ncbi:MAG: ABC transporter ATP-binding protein [Planctomycetota bacterium]
MPEALIQLNNIVKDYKTMRALDGVDLEVFPGITGLLGPNGAGKSTLIKVLLGLVRVSGGSGTVLGHKLAKEGKAIRNKVGYMPEDDCYIAGMSGIQVVQFSASLAGLPGVEALRRSHEILDFCGMQQERYRTIETYSTGMRQKIKFAAAIVHDPEFLIFDEPTSGLDPEERESLLNRIKILASTVGKSVIISTHILPDVQAICDQVVILQNGKVRLNETLDELNRPSEASVSIRVNGDVTPISDFLYRQNLQVTAKPNGKLVVGEDANDSSGGLNTTERNQRVAAIVWQGARETGTTIQSLTPAKNSLEEIFMSVVSEAANADS